MNQDIIGDIAKLEDWSGSVQISTCQGLDLPRQASPNKQSESPVAKQEVPLYVVEHETRTWGGQGRHIGRPPSEEQRGALSDAKACATSDTIEDPTSIRRKWTGLLPWWSSDHQPIERTIFVMQTHRPSTENGRPVTPSNGCLTSQRKKNTCRLHLGPSRPLARRLPKIEHCTT